MNPEQIDSAITLCEKRMTEFWAALRPANIDLDKPLCGLGKDYEPETVWVGENSVASKLSIAPLSYGLCYDTEIACLAYSNNIKAHKISVPDATQRARQMGFNGIILVNIAGTASAKWPI